MQLYEMQVSKTTITRAEPALIPKGIIGAVVKLSFSAEWEGLTKTAVFRAGEVTKDVADIQDAVVIPTECTREEGELLQLGIYGVDAQGTVAIPTLWASIGRITEAADPSGDETTDPSLPVWAQVLEMVKQLEEQGVTQNEVEQAVKDFFGGALPAGRTTEEGGEIFNFYTDPVYTGDDPPKEFPGNTAAKGAHAQNFGTHADGEYSSASGWNSTASGGIANATGRETEASGYAATTEGHLTKASGRCAHAGGKESEATGENSFAYGLKAKATKKQAFAVGEEVEATGENAFAHGLKSKATGSRSYAGGKESEATGVNAFAHGYKAKASSNTSFATGEDTEASGFYAVASGYKTKASGTCSNASGRDTEAQQYASSAQGRGTIATSRNQSVRGAYNIPDTPDANGNGKYADIVGGGKNADDRANIYTLDWAGNAEFAGVVKENGVRLMPQKCTYINGAVSADTITEPFVLLNISAENTKLRSLLGNANYAYIQTQYYNSVTGWRLQIAWSYAVDPARMAFRTEYQNVWSEWDTFAKQGEIPIVYAWAKASKKPSYTAAEVGAVPTSRTVNGKALSSDISLSASDVGAVSASQPYIVAQATVSDLEMKLKATYDATVTVGTYFFDYTCRKWSDGIIEIFGRSKALNTGEMSHVTTTASKAWGSLYETGAFVLPPYPEELKSCLYANVSFASLSGNVVWAEGGHWGNLYGLGNVYFCRADREENTVNDVQGNVCTYTVGTWK